MKRSFALTFISVCVAVMSVSCWCRSSELSSWQILGTPPPSNQRECKPSQGPGEGKISGTLTAVGTDEKTVFIHCDCSSTTATFAKKSAHYALDCTVPFGEHVITVELFHYKTIKKRLRLSKSRPNAVCSLVLCPIEKEIELTCSPPRILPDGKSETTITAVIVGPVGKRYAQEAIKWAADAGAVVRSDKTTDEQGIARLTLRAPKTPGTAIVSATAGSAQSRCAVEFAALQAPSIWIAQPRNGQTVSGDVHIWMYAIKAGQGGDDGSLMRTLYIDGNEYSSCPCCIWESFWDTTRAPNGKHTLNATLSDSAGNVGYSNVVSVEVRNPISAFAVTPSSIIANQPVRIAAKLIKKQAWRVRVEDLDDKEVWSTAGTSDTINTTWPGTTTRGLYTVSVKIQSGQSVEELVVFN